MNYATPEFWLLIAFLLLLCGLGKRVYLLVTKALDQHAQTVTDQLEEAKHLQDEAESLLNTYKGKYRNALQEIEDLKAFAEQEVADFKASTEKAYRTFKKEREAQAKERLGVVEKDFLDKLRTEAVEATLLHLEKSLLKDEKTRKAFTLETLQNLKQMSPPPIIID